MKKPRKSQDLRGFFKLPSLNSNQDKENQNNISAGLEDCSKNRQPTANAMKTRIINAISCVRR